MSTKRSISCGSKIFLLGEYLALTGGPALVAALEPGFSLLPSDEIWSPSSGSPASRILEGRTDLKGRFHDPLEGEGGIGRSTAEAAFALYHQGIRDAVEAWGSYREITRRDSDPPPSGYDLLAQWSGGLHWIQGSDRASLKLDPVSLAPDWNFILFTASHLRKVPTHQHLSDLPIRDFHSLIPAVQLGRSSLDRDDLSGVGEAMNHFADAAHELGLEHPEAHEDRMAFQELGSVAGVKGSGALLADVMIVLLKPEASLMEVLNLARDRGLRMFSRGLRLSLPIREL